MQQAIDLRREDKSLVSCLLSVKGGRNIGGQMLVGRTGDAAPERGDRRPGLAGSTVDVQGTKTIPVKRLMEVCSYIFFQTHGIYSTE